MRAPKHRDGGVWAQSALQSEKRGGPLWRGVESQLSWNELWLGKCAKLSMLEIRLRSRGLLCPDHSHPSAGCRVSSLANATNKEDLPVTGRRKNYEHPHRGCLCHAAASHKRLFDDGLPKAL